MSTKIRPWAWALFAIPVLPYVVMYAAWMPSHLFLPDDAFYYFEIASNFSQGFGSTFDRVNPTNGYHPLWFLMLSACAVVVTSHEGLVSLALVLQCVLVAVSWMVASKLLYPQMDRKRLTITVLVSVCLMWNYYVSKMIINGLESALFLALVMPLLWKYSHWVTDAGGISLRRGAWLGMLTTLVVLSRLDSVFYICAMVVVWFLYRRGQLREDWKGLFVLVGIPAVVLLAYMALNQELFGVAMPVSGFVKRSLYFRTVSTGNVVAFAVFVGMVVLGIRLSLGRLRPVAGQPRDAALWLVSVFLIVHAADSMLVRGRTVPEIWYLCQHVLWAFLVGTLIVDRVLDVASPYVRYPVVAGLLGIAALGMVLTWTVRLQRLSYDVYMAKFEAAQWINAHLPADTVLAGWDVGIVGYYSEPQVSNLDGLVNSRAYAELLRQNKTLEFLDDAGAEYIVQYYKLGIERFIRRGLDTEEFCRRTKQVVWSRPIRHASMGEFLATGRRTAREYLLEIREYRSQNNDERQAPRADR